MRAKNERVKSVNELILDRPANVRQTAVQTAMTEIFRSTMQYPEFHELRETAKEFDCERINGRAIRNFGQKAATETIGSLGIFLTQFTEEQIMTALTISRRRRCERWG